MTYAYKVRDRQGKLVTGTLEAESVSVVSAKLRSMGYVPVSIEDSGAGRSLSGREIKIPGLSGRIKLKEVAVFSRQFATMINSGLTLLRALSILTEQTENKELARIVGEVRKDVERGSALSAALAKHPKAFSRLYVAMVRSGETGGSLDSVLLRLATTIEKQVELRRKVKSAMTYPIVVGFIVVLILIAMLIFVVPMFKGMYGDLNAKLPLPTTVLLTVSNIFKKFFLLVFAAAGAGAWAAKRYIGTPDGRRRWDAFKLRAPVFGQLAHKTALARFSRSLAALVRSGVPILDALEIVSETAGNMVVSEAVTDTQAAVKAGESLAKPLEAHPVFPAMVVQMIAVGEETGALDEMLEKIADFYDGEVEATVDALTSLIEPLLIVVMGVAVGGMVVALYMPMFSIISKLDGGGARGCPPRPAHKGAAAPHQLPSGVDGLVDERRSGAGHDVARRLVGRARVRPGRHRLLRLGHGFAELVEVAPAQKLVHLGEEVSLLFLDMVPDVLHQHRHLGVEPLVVGGQAFELRQHPLDDVVLLERLEHHLAGLAAVRRLPDGRVEEHLLDHGVDRQLADDPVHDVPLRLHRSGAELLEAFEEILDRLVVVLQQRDCVHGRAVPGRNCQQTRRRHRSFVRIRAIGAVLHTQAEAQKTDHSS